MANATQRAGRAGRVRAGCCYHLFLKREEEGARPASNNNNGQAADNNNNSGMSLTQEAEVVRAPLDALCLRLKALGFPSVRKAMAGLPSPPTKASVELALKGLERLSLLQTLPTPGGNASLAGGGSSGAAGGSSGKGGPGKAPTSSSPALDQLTPLGQAVASLPMEPRLGKLVVTGAALQCLTSACVVAASLEVRTISSSSLSLFARNYCLPSTNLPPALRPSRHDQSSRPVVVAVRGLTRLGLQRLRGTRCQTILPCSSFTERGETVVPAIAALALVVVAVAVAVATHRSHASTASQPSPCRHFTGPWFT